MLLLETASQSIALFIIIFLKDKGKELSGSVRIFFIMVRCQAFLILCVI